MKKYLPIIIAILTVLGWNQFNSGDDELASRASDYEVQTNDQDWRGGQQVRGRGEVVRVLTDDNEGSRHQRFIVRLQSGRTLLIAHNIDLAPRVPSIRSGDVVSFNGEFEDNDRGGVIHWTHHDPRGRHEAGWIEHNGKKYQ